MENHEDRRVVDGREKFVVLKIGSARVNLCFGHKTAQVIKTCKGTLIKENGLAFGHREPQIDKHRGKGEQAKDQHIGQKEQIGQTSRACEALCHLNRPSHDRG